MINDWPRRLSPCPYSMDSPSLLHHLYFAGDVFLRSVSARVRITEQRECKRFAHRLTLRQIWSWSQLQQTLRIMHEI